jgi:site-specific recombinase XerD
MAKAKRKKPATKRPPEVFERHEVLALIGANSKRAKSGPRNAALIGLGYRAGLRVSEALALNVRDVSMKDGQVFVRHGKGDKHRRVHVDEQALDLVRQWLDVRRTLKLKRGAPLFCTLTGDALSSDYVRQMMPRLAKRAGIEKRCSYHCLRHTFASELAAESVPVHQIQALLGHSNLSVTSIYLARISSHEQKALADAREPWLEGGAA